MRPGSLPPDHLPTDFLLPSIHRLGELLNAGLGLFFNNLGLILKVTLPVWIPGHIFAAVLIYTYGAQENIWTQYRVGTVLEAVLGTLTAPALIYALVAKLRSGAAPPLRQCYAWGVRQWGRTLVNRLLSGLITLAGLFLLIVPGLVLYTWFVLVDPIVAIEADTQPHVLTRSRELTQGHRWMVFGTAVLMFAIFMGGSIIFSLPLSAADNWVSAAIANVATEVLLQLLTVTWLAAYLAFLREERERHTLGEPNSQITNSGQSGL